MRLALAQSAVVLRPSLTAPTNPEAERRIALVIGNAAYQGADPLANPVNEARAIAAKLKALNFEVISV